jgi:hypothetical protein
MTKIGTIDEEEEAVKEAPEEGADPEAAGIDGKMSQEGKDSKEELAMVEAARLEILKAAVEEMKSLLDDTSLTDETKVAKLRTAMAEARRRVLQTPGAPTDESRLASLFKAKMGEVKAALDNPETTEAKLAVALKLKAAEVREVMADPEARGKIFGQKCTYIGWLKKRTEEA